MVDETIITLGIAAIGVAVTWGALQARLKKLEQELDKIEQSVENIRENYVPMTHFEAITEPIRDQVAEIQKDIKTILLIVSRNESTRRDKKETP